MWRWMSAALGALCGGAVGLFGPVLVMSLLDIGTGSYEDVLVAWLLAVPSGVVVGGVAGFAAMGLLLARR